MPPNAGRPPHGREIRTAGQRQAAPPPTPGVPSLPPGEAPGIEDADRFAEPRPEHPALAAALARVKPRAVGLRQTHGPRSEGPAPSPQPTRDRLTFTLGLAFQNHGASAVGAEVSGVYHCESSDDEPTDRKRATFGPEPVRLLARSVTESPGVVAVLNLTGRDRPTQPTEEERRADLSAVLVIERPGQADPVGYAPVGFPFCALVPRPEELTIRSAAGTATARVIVIPR